MASSTFARFNTFTEDLANGVHNLSTDEIKIALFGSLPAVTAVSYTDVIGSEITAENNYAAGGKVISGTSISQTGGVATFSGASITFSATGGSFGPFRYAIVYNNSAASKNLIGWYDYGSLISLDDTETFTINVVTNIFTIS